MVIHGAFITLIALFAVQSKAFVGRHERQILSFVANKPRKLSSLLATDVSGSNEWTTLYKPRVSSTYTPLVFNVNDIMFVIWWNGGLQNVKSFNCTTGKWREYTNRDKVYKVCVAAALNDHSFVAVGGLYNAFICIISELNWGWIMFSLPNLKKLRRKPGIVCLDNKVYVMGGYNPQEQRYEDTIEMLDMSLPSDRREWTLLPSRMKQARKGCSAVVGFNGTIVVTGGEYNEWPRKKVLNSVEVFDTHTQKWRSTMPLPPMLSPRAYHSTVSLNNGKTIIAIGGCACGTKKPELLRFDNDGNALEWVPIPSGNTALALFVGFALTSGPQPGVYVYGWGHRSDTMEFLPNPSTRDITYWTLLNPPTIKQKRFTTIGPGEALWAQERYNQARANECIRDMEKERNNYRAQVNTFIQSICTVDDQGWKRSRAIQGQTQSGLGNQKWIKRIDTLRRTADAYSAKVEGRIGRIRRLMAILMQVDFPAIQGLPHGSWDFRNKIQVERWVEDTKREFLECRIHEQLMDVILDREFDKDVETWIEKIQQQWATEYNDCLMHGRRIVEFWNSWNHPLINDVPRGALDSTHKAQIEAWVQDNARERRYYANRVAAAIKDMRE